MNTQATTDGRSFRFRTGKGQWLTDEIISIETLATERLHAGVSYHSVQTGALALLKLLLEGVAGKLVESACPLPTEPPRCAAPER